MKMIGILLSVSLFWACQGKTDRLSQTKAGALMQRAMVHFHLTDLPQDCLDIVEEKGEQFYTWIVSNKGGRGCGSGEPENYPFKIRTDLASGEITSDAGSLEKEFKVLH